MSSDVVAELRRHFGFLATDYGLQFRRTPSDRWDRKWVPSVAYANETTGVFIQFDVRDAYLNVGVFRLEGGEFPMRGGRVSLAQGCLLNGVVYLDDPSKVLDSMYSEQLKNVSLGEYLEIGARLLREHGNDLLRGDFSRSEQIKRAVDEIGKNRAVAKPYAMS